VRIEMTLTAPITQVTSSGITVAMATAHRVIGPAGQWTTSTIDGPHSVQLGPGETYRLDWIVALHTSRDTSEPHEKARRQVARAIEDVSSVIDDHTDAWLARWKLSDLRIEGDPAAQRAVRFAIYHLVSAANPQDDRVSIGARGLTGAAYKGHVFWDTDIFLLPFFIHTYPEAARALVMYRYHTLVAARAKAARLGYRGALSRGRRPITEKRSPALRHGARRRGDTDPHGEQEHHISADVAFSVWRYWEATGDEFFLVDAGAEILTETTRFWASRAVREDDGRYHIRRVIWTG
jgi:kojibiose phosphorylase